MVHALARIRWQRAVRRINWNASLHDTFPQSCALEVHIIQARKLQRADLFASDPYVRATVTLTRPDGSTRHYTLLTSGTTTMPSIHTTSHYNPQESLEELLSATLHDAQTIQQDSHDEW